MAGAPFLTGTASFHTRRLDARRKSLERIFSVSAMQSVWTKYVRPGLRDQDVPDLHDYNDYHWGRHQLFENLHSEICAGRYSPLRSTPIRVEKKYGVTRTLVLPDPLDCVVLQCIVEDILPGALKKQPSKNSFFSRSHGFKKPTWSFEKDYIWFKRWAEFSKIRFDMVSVHKCICTTDVANYFDNIYYTHLRNMFSIVDGVQEVTLDILFSVLDKISWRPDYLPPPGRSLPQVHFDAPRLLAHIYLYEIDEFLKKETDNNFVRWVDDMTFAVQSVSQGKRLLRDLDQLLMTRGLRLNSGKTRILSAAEARNFFHEDENKYLSLEKELLKSAGSDCRKLARVDTRLKKRFLKFQSAPPHGHSEKILKRYINMFSDLADVGAVAYCASKFVSEPALRETICRYFSVIGPNRTAFVAMKDYILSDHALDDASLMSVAKVITEWEVKPRSAMNKNIIALMHDLSEGGYIDRNPFYFYVIIWLAAKYARRAQISHFINKHQSIWVTSEFLSRQLAAVLPKYRGHAEGNRLRQILETHRFRSSYSVLISLERMLENAPRLHSDVRLYVLNGKHTSKYSIQRFLILIHVLSSARLDPALRKSLRDEVLRYVSDPTYVKVLKALHF